MRADQMPSQSAQNRAIDIATEKAEATIQKILRDLEYDTMCTVDRVEVDTRNHATYATEIFLRRVR